MGNTNLPQFGAADHKNSRDTRPGIEQLTDKQKRKASQPPVQAVVTPDPAVSVEEALAGYVDTGHSSSNAT